jgi:cytochrome P450
MALKDIPMLSGARGLGGHIAQWETDRFGFLSSVVREIDDIGRIRLLTRDMAVVNSPASIHEVLVEKAKYFEKAPTMRIGLDPLAGEGLFTSEGPLWRRQRRLMAPMFQHTKIDTFAPVMVELAQHACADWADGQELDIAHVTTGITMAVAGRTLFGFDTLSESDALAQALTVTLQWADYAPRALPTTLQVEFRLALLGLTGLPEPLNRQLTRLTKWLEAPIMWPTHRCRELQAAVAILDERVQRMIEERRTAQEPKPDLLTHLLRARDEDDGGVMTDKQVRDEILTLFLAGHETTALGLAWSIYLLARNPNAYARARAAVDALGGRAPTLDDLPRLEFLTRVFKEALRLYPGVFLFARISTTDVTIAGHDLAARTMVLVSPWALHRRPDVWPDPLRFDPERFTPEAEAARSRDDYIPFSDGPRVCIGAHFAMIEAPLVLATLLQRADFELTSDREIVGAQQSSTMRPAGGIPVRLKLRAALSRAAELRA